MAELTVLSSAFKTESPSFRAQRGISLRLPQPHVPFLRFAFRREYATIAVLPLHSTLADEPHHLHGGFSHHAFCCYRVRAASSRNLYSVPVRHRSRRIARHGANATPPKPHASALRRYIRLRRASHRRKFYDRIRRTHRTAVGPRTRTFSDSTSSPNRFALGQASQQRIASHTRRPYRPRQQRSSGARRRRILHPRSHVLWRKIKRCKSPRRAARSANFSSACRSDARWLRRSCHNNSRSAAFPMARPDD